MAARSTTAGTPVKSPAGHQRHLVVRDDAVSMVPQHVFQQNAD
jgi:hypothetical protein